MMTSPAPRKPLSNTSTASPRARQPENSPSRTTANPPPASGQGVNRTSSVRGGRPIRRAPARTSISQEGEDDNDDLKESNAQLIADLKEQVERAELASEQYRRQLETLQKRLDEVTDEQTAAEERDFAARTQIDKLSAEIKDSARQKRELELNFESERKLMLQDRERQTKREEELQSTVGRLTETLKMKSLERASAARMESAPGTEEPTPTESSSAGAEHFQLIQEKDSTIEALKLELADVHFKFAEQEHMGDGRLQSLEKEMQDIKMQNARLVEENDSFQMLLSEKTLKGDFMTDHNADTSKMSSLADELESIGEDEEVSVEQYRKVENDLKNLREEKKALTLYIDKIIGRLLQHEGFEHIITGKDEEDDAPAPPPKAGGFFSKPLPTPPPAASASPPTTDMAATGMSFLQRARSVVVRNPTAPKPRPMSYMPSAPTANENPETAPSIPINKGHRRVRSDQAQPDLGAAAVVQQMNRGSPLRTASGNTMSPGISPLQRAQTSYFAPTNTAERGGQETPAQSETSEKNSSANSIVSENSLDREPVENNSTRRVSNKRESVGASLPGAVMKQNQLRPLRLVQERTAADEEATKKAKRGSWMGWFNQGANPD